MSAFYVVNPNAKVLGTCDWCAHWVDMEKDVVYVQRSDLFPSCREKLCEQCLAINESGRRPKCDSCHTFCLLTQGRSRCCGASHHLEIKEPK